jgi:hypothetical protein
MFDVIWTDPNRELVGQRIDRKEGEAKDRRKQELGHQSVSTCSFSSSERGFGLFGSKSRKRAATPSEPKLSPPSPALPATEGVQERCPSICGVKSLLSHEDDSEITVKPTDAIFGSPRLPEPTESSSSVSSRGMR